MQCRRSRSDGIDVLGHLETVARVDDQGWIDYDDAQITEALPDADEVYIASGSRLAYTANCPVTCQ